MRKWNFNDGNIVVKAIEYKTSEVWYSELQLLARKHPVYKIRQTLLIVSSNSNVISFGLHCELAFYWDLDLRITYHFLGTMRVEASL